MTSTTVQVHRVYIKAKPQAVWEAITDPRWMAKYGYGTGFESTPRPGQPYRMLTTEDMRKAGPELGFDVPEVAVDGEVVSMDPPHRLVLTWRMAMDEGLAAEGFTRLTYEIEEVPNQAGYTKLTVVHDLEGAPNLAVLVAGEQEDTGAGGGWPWVLSDLKSLLETGAGLAG